MDIIDLRDDEERQIEHQATKPLNHQDEKIANKLYKLERYIWWSEIKRLSLDQLRQLEGYRGTVNEERKDGLERDIIQTKAGLFNSKKEISAFLADLKNDHGLEPLDPSEAEKEVRNIGVYLGANGGDDRMRMIAYRVKSLGGRIQALEYSWVGICGWQI